MNRLERALWEALDVAIDRANEAEAGLQDRNEGGVLRADFDAVCRERDAALEREGELQRKLHDVSQERNELSAEASNLHAKLDTYRWELDEARAVARAEIDKVCVELDRVRSERDTYKAARDDLARGKEGYATADAMRLFKSKTPQPDENGPPGPLKSGPCDEPDSPRS
jgi:predicted  nucleic acid-binding Zn-ribbon protein